MPSAEDVMGEMKRRKEVNDLENEKARQARKQGGKRRGLGDVDDTEEEKGPLVLSKAIN